MSTEKNRYAYEWFMREQDKLYYSLSKKFAKDEIKKAQKKMKTLMAVSIVISEVIMISFLRYRFLKLQK